MEIINLKTNKIGKIKLIPELKLIVFDFLFKFKNPKELFLKILECQIIKPKITNEKFNKLTRKDIKNIINLFINANNLHKYYKKYKGKSSYYSFRIALKKWEKDALENNFRFSMENIIKKLAEDKKLFGKNYKKLVKILAKSNWFFQFEFTSSIGYQIINAYIKGHYDEIDNIMIDAIKQSINVFTDCWFRTIHIKSKKHLKCLKKREEYIKEGIKAHLEGRYFLSITALAFHIEGIIWDFLVEKIKDKKELKNISNDILIKFEKFLKIINEKLKADTLKGPYFKIILYKDKKGKLKTKLPFFKFVNFVYPHNLREINRHMLAHGVINKKLINEKNSLKLISMIHFLWFLISEYERVNEGLI